MDSFGLLLMHMSPALVMVTVLIINHTVRRQRDKQREAEDHLRLALALSVELRSLLESYNENLNLIAAGSPFLVSTRASGALYRASLNRLLGCLDESALGEVVSAFSYQLRIEAFLCACTKPNGGFGVLVQPKTPMQDLKQRYVRGVRSVQRALAVLEPLVGPQPETIPVRATVPAVAAPQPALTAAQ